VIETTFEVLKARWKGMGRPPARTVLCHVPTTLREAAVVGGRVRHPARWKAGDRGARAWALSIRLGAGGARFHHRVGIAAPVVGRGARVLVVGGGRRHGDLLLPSTPSVIRWVDIAHANATETYKRQSHSMARRCPDQVIDRVEAAPPSRTPADRSTTYWARESKTVVPVGLPRWSARQARGPLPVAWYWAK